MDKKAMNALSYGLFVITAADGGRDNGCITNTVAQVTSSPNRVSLTMNKENFTHGLIMSSGRFNVSVLSEKADFSIFKHFGFQSGRDTDKFADYTNAFRTENGLYCISGGTNAWLSAGVVQSIDLGTHTMFIADVTDGAVLSGDPSATYTYYHKFIKPAPAAAKSAKTRWVCRICGYIYEGEELPADFVCPLCKHGAADFDRMA